MQKTFKVSISNGRNRTLSTSSSVSFETDLFISEPEIPYLNSSRRVLVLLMFELFLYSRPSHCFLSLHLLEDCKVALLPLYVSGPRFPIIRIQDENDFG